MEREHHCENCGFDLSRLDMTVLYARKGMETRKLHCPLCRSDRVRLTALERVFPRPTTGRWVRWREGGAAGASSNVIPVGHLRLKVESEIEALSKEQVCFRQVPVFVSGNARVWPALPVMPEYMDCLDPAQVRLARERPEGFGRVIQERGKARYQCVLPLRGLKATEWPTYECDLLPANPFAGSAGDLDAVAFRGVSVKVWPNLKRPTHRWKYYVAAVQAVTEEGMTLFAQGRSFRARMLVPPDAEGRPASETTLQAVKLDQELGREGDAGGNPTGVVGATRDGRPAWISVEFVHPPATPGGREEPVGGGLFPLRPAADTEPGDTWSLGVDFGTSNTVVAIKRRDNSTQCVSPERGKLRESTTLHLVHGGNQTVFKGLDLWPGGEWSGPFRDLLPSELGCVRRWTDVATEKGILDLAFGKDFGVPLRGAQATISSDHVVSEFKWLRAVEKDKSALAQRPLVQALQARFLEGAMLMTAASLLAEEEASPRTVNVNYSFPLAFDEEDLETLRLAGEHAGVQLKALTGADFVFPPTPLVDEAQAAAGNTPSDKMFRVYLDLGGGSLEILVDDTLARNNHQGHQGLHPHVFSTSIFFGGSVYLRSLIGASESDRRGACVMPAMASYTRLASVVRQSTSGRALLESPNVISENRKSTAERRARVYFGYIVEWVARAVAAVCLEHGRSPEAKVNLSRNRLFTVTGSGADARWILGTSRGPGQKRAVEFSLVLLGNGWGFGDIVRDGMKTVEQMMAMRVYERLQELLKETPVAREITDGDYALLDPRLALEVSYVLPAEGTHRKAAVALGLLGSHHTTEDAQRFFKKRAPERHGVLGFDLWLNDSGRRVPWFRPFGPPAEDDPQLREHPRLAPSTTSTQVVDKAPTAPPTAAAPAPIAPAGMPPGAAPLGVASPWSPPLEYLVFQLTQQWPQVLAQAAQQGMSPQEFAGRQLFAQVGAVAASQGLSTEQLLARERWQQVLAQASPPGMPPEYTQWVQQQQAQALAQQAALRGQTVEAFLASQRWEQLSAQLPR
ncbi:MAG: hypothetical protein HY909_30370 [Deltaproteobacteria bacterium]|nr:hypothetical protein [Deltaproteobacteria bacterium]